MLEYRLDFSIVVVNIVLGVGCMQILGVFCCCVVVGCLLYASM